MIQTSQNKNQEIFITDCMLLALPALPILKMISGIAREFFPFIHFDIDQEIHFGSSNVEMKKFLSKFVQKDVNVTGNEKTKIIKTMLQSNHDRIHLISKIAYDFKIGVKYGISIPVGQLSPLHLPPFESHGNIFSSPVIIRNLSPVNFPKKVPSITSDLKQLRDHIQEFLIAREFVKIRQKHALIALIPITALSVISTVVWLNQPKEVPLLVVYFANTIASYLILCFNSYLDLVLDKKAEQGAIQYLGTNEGSKAFCSLKAC
jgi:hypothetical protein